MFSFLDLRLRTSCSHAPTEGLDAIRLQFATEEFLHGLALECRAQCEFIADFLGHTSDGDLYWHECIMPALTAFRNHQFRHLRKSYSRQLIYLRDLADFDCGMTKAWPRSFRW